MQAANSNVLSYTPANRLASASGAWGGKAYTYDGVGNRITDVTTGGSSILRTQYYSNTSNRLNDIWKNGAQLRVYTYDGAGNTLTETRPGEAFAYTYNKRNRLASVTRNGSLWGTYVYNAFEQLVSRTSPAPAAPLGTVHYIHDLDGHLIAEADGATGATLRDYVWLPSNDNEVQDLPLAVIDGVNTATHVTSFIHTDHLGRPTRMTNAAKVTVWQAVWTPWGEAQSMTGSVTQNLRFPGQYFQIETNLNYNHHRQYDPATGRYTQPDPLGFVDGPSDYAYAGNSPWMNVDREGLQDSGPPPPRIPGGPWTWSANPGNGREGTWQGAKRTDGTRYSGNWDPEGQHYDIDDGYGKRQRYNRHGVPISKEDAHGGYRGPKRVPFTPRTNLPFIFIEPLWEIEKCRIDPMSPGCQNVNFFSNSQSAPNLLRACQIGPSYGISNANYVSK